MALRCGNAGNWPSAERGSGNKARWQHFNPYENFRSLGATSFSAPLPAALSCWPRGASAKKVRLRAKRCVRKRCVTLNVSLRVPDGIVLASDSLSTQTEPINQKLNVTGKCDACGKQIEIRDVQAPPINVPSSTWPYTQKLFPIAERFGLATYGSAFVNGRSIYNHVVELTPRLPKPKEGEDHFSAVSKVICDYFVEQQQKQLSAWGIEPALLPDEWFPFGFQLVGFRTVGVPEPTAWTHWIRIGKIAMVEDVTGLGCYCSGDLSVVALLWPAKGAAANYGAFSLQDAIDYAKFLIRTTADYQRFSGRLPTVGGDIDIVLVTNHRGFQWIQQKELYRILDKPFA